MNARVVRHASELITNVVLLIVCVVVVFAIAGGNISRSTRNVSSAWQSGDQFPNLPAIRPGGPDIFCLFLSPTIDP